MCIRRPSRRELEHVLESVDIRTLNLLLKMTGTCTESDEPISSIGLILKLAVFDWMTAYNVMTPAVRQDVFLTVDLADFGREFEKAEEVNTGSRVRPVGAFTILDFRFVKVFRPNWYGDQYYDTETGIHTMANLSRPPLTTLACDLSTLLLRLLGRVERFRRQNKDVSDAQPAS